MALWYPKASRSATAPVDGGSFVGGGRKGLFHTTEGSTAAGAIASFRQTNFWPHFTASFEGGAFRIWQHIPLNRAARALVNLPGGVETNRADAIQIELVGFATHPPSAPSYLAGIAAWMRWVEASFGVPRRSTVRFKAYPASYGTSNGVRLSGSAWTGYGGRLGHMHVPENQHGDPGALDVAALLQGDDDMPFTKTDLENAAYTGAKRALNEGTGSGQTSWARTEHAILATVQALVNILNQVHSDLGHKSDEILAALTAAPTTALPEETKQQVAETIASHIQGLDPEQVLAALHADA